jgi:hypothetical protein
LGLIFHVLKFRKLFYDIYIRLINYGVGTENNALWIAVNNIKIFFLCFCSLFVLSLIYGGSRHFLYESQNLPLVIIHLIIIASIIPIFIMSWALNVTLNILNLIASLLCILQLFIELVKWVSWRISLYNKGAFSAIILLLTLIMAAIKYFLNK